MHAIAGIPPESPQSSHTWPQIMVERCSLGWHLRSLFLHFPETAGKPVVFNTDYRPRD